MSAISLVSAYLPEARILQFYAWDDFEASFSVIYIGACGVDTKDISLTVHDDVTLYPLDLLESVDALGRVRQTAPAARAVYETNRGTLVSSRFDAGMSEKDRMDFIKQSRRVPVPPFVVDRFPVWIARRKQPPLATTAYKIHHGLQNEYRVMPFDAFHQFRKQTDQGEPLLRLNPGNVNIGIIIFLRQISS